MAGLSYHSLRAAHEARKSEESKTEQRKRNLLILVLQYLNAEGYRDSAEKLGHETNIDVNCYEVCDNVDLETILMDYETFYHFKFSKYPKITKKLTHSAGERKSSECSSGSSTSKPAGSSLPRISASTHSQSSPPPGRQRSSSNKSRSQLGSKKDTTKPEQTSESGVSDEEAGSAMAHIGPGDRIDNLILQGLSVSGSGQSSANFSEQTTKQKFKFGQIIDVRAMLNDVTRINVEEGADFSNRLLKPLGGYLGYSNEWRELAQVISKDIYSENPNVQWDDIIGLDEAKRLVKEAVVYPIKYPQLFQGILSPWKGLLLYGPPGTGKTLLAKAVATVCNTTFFNISASSIVSKWRGDSEKLVRVLFELARFHAPSTIFLDELDSLMSQRGSNGMGSEHEGSRRLKTELLVQMDGLAKTDDLVFLLAASNLPWELDHAMLRRLEKRILVDLPTCEARKSMFKHHLPSVVCPKEHGLELLANLDYDLLALKTEGYSGSDIRLVCKEAAMQTVRKIFNALENHSESEKLHIQLDTLTTADVEVALAKTKPSAKALSKKYIAWQHEYEST